MEELMRLWIICNALSVGVAGLFIAGCVSGTHHAAPGTPALIAQYVPQDTAASDNKAAAREPTGTLTLQQALVLALLQNPELKAFSYGIRAAEARTLQAGVLPNPKLELEVEEYDPDGEGLDGAEVVVGVGQAFELGGKRRWRRRVAEAKQELIEWDYESTRLELFSETARRFVLLLAAQRHVELAKSTVDVAQQTHRVVDERVKAGKEPPLQRSKASAEMEMARLEELEAKNNLTVARTKLAVLWGAEQARFRTAQGNLDDLLDSVPPLDVLRARLAQNPELARWDAELRLHNATLSSQRAAAIPDLKASVAYQSFREAGTDALAFGLGMAVPIFDRNQGNIAAARHALTRAEQERKVAETGLAADLAAAHSRLTSAHQRALALRAKVIPSVDEAFRVARDGYEQGKFEFLDVLDAQRELVKVRGAFVAALTDYHSAVADIQRITGSSIQEQGNPKKEQ